MPKIKKKQSYKYYKLIIRTKKRLEPAALKVLKRQIWKLLEDISMVDLQLRQCSKPQMRFEGDPVVRK